MKALAVYPGKADSLHQEDVPEPSLDAIPDGRGVLVEMVRVGICGTDEEINAGQYGTAPAGSDFLILGHENLGRVVKAGANAPPELQPGSYVVSTVRRPGRSLYDAIGRQDFTTDDTYYERGISRLHGYLAERYVEDAAFVVPLPPVLSEVGVLLEPASVVEKGIAQAYAVQRRLFVWRPERAAVLGAGPIGLLAALALRLRGFDVTVYSQRVAPFLKSDIAEAIGCHYVSSKPHSLAEASKRFGPYDLIFEATGYSPLVFEAMAALGKNGVLVLSSVTGGGRTAEVPADTINQGFVLGNKVAVGTVNAARIDFETGAGDLIKAEALYPGWLARLLPTPVHGLDRYADLMAGHDPATTIKVYLEVLRAEG
jgi:threonine dehydrogenase-like Zn-dependent dehydrogenase